MEVTVTKDNEAVDTIVVNFIPEVTSNFTNIFVDPDGFVDPYNSIWLKLITIGIYVVELVASFIMIAFVIYEKDYGHFRTLINQLLSYLYGTVRKFIINVLLQIFLLRHLICCCVSRNHQSQQM